MRVGQVDLTKTEKSAKIAGVKVIWESLINIALSLLCFPDPRGLQKNWCRFERRHSHCDPKQGGGRVSQYNSY